MKKWIDFVAKRPVLITLGIFVLFYFLPFKPKPFGDGEYHEGTINLIEYILNGFSGPIRVDKGILTLFYYLIPYSLAYPFGSDAVYYHLGLSFNAAMLALSVFLLFRAFDAMQFSKKAKLWTIIALNLFPIHIYYGMGILAETMAFFAVSLFVFALTMTNLRGASTKSTLLLAGSLLLLVGSRPNLLPFGIAFMGYFMLMKVGWRQKLMLISTFAVVTVGLVQFEKSVSQVDENFKSVVFRRQLLWSRFELRDEPFNWLPQHGQDEFSSTDYKNNLRKRRELDSICNANNLDHTAYYIDWVKNDIVQNPLLTLRQYSLKFFQSQSFIITPLAKSAKSPIVKWSVHIYINLINYTLVLVGLIAMYRLAKTRKFTFFIPFLLFWGWSLAYVFIFHSEQRYLFPFRPVLIFLFCYWLSARFQKREGAV